MSLPTSESVSAEFERRKAFIDALRHTLGPTSYGELADVEGATKTAVYNALKDGVSKNHDRGLARIGPSRDELLKSIAKTMAPMSKAEVARRLRELADEI